ALPSVPIPPLMLSSRCALLPSYKWSTKESSLSAFTTSMTLKMLVKHIPTCRTVKPPALLSSGCNQAAQISANWHQSALIHNQDVASTRVFPVEATSKLYIYVLMPSIEGTYLEENG